MKPILIKAFLLAMAASPWMPLRADDTKPAAYGPAVVSLRGKIVKEGYGDDPSPIDRGRTAWILRLDRAITVPATPGDEINTEERNVMEVHLNVNHTRHPVSKGAFGKTRFKVTGTLYHGINSHHLRPVVMLVSNLVPVRAKARHD